MGKKLQLLMLWRSLVKWLRTLLLDIGKGKKMGWIPRLAELVSIANRYMDIEGYKKLDQDDEPHDPAKKSNR